MGEVDKLLPNEARNERRKRQRARMKAAAIMGDPLAQAWLRKRKEKEQDRWQKKLAARAAERDAT